MQIIETDIPDVLIIEPKMFGDQRGFFTRDLSGERYAAAGIERSFLQDNLSRSITASCAGCICRIRSARQARERGCAARCSMLPLTCASAARHSGGMWRWNSPMRTGGSFWVPRGFAHGFACCRRPRTFSTNAMNSTIRRRKLVVAGNDPALGISWGVDKPTLSARDAAGRRLVDIANLPKYGSI
jgi:dTDP-4-dehydrorhamnose 3,5-epimerase